MGKVLKRKLKIPSPQEKKEKAQSHSETWQTFFLWCRNGQKAQDCEGLKAWPTGTRSEGGSVSSGCCNKYCKLYQKRQTSIALGSGG
jgi:hypothetical protein